MPKQFDNYDAAIKFVEESFGKGNVEIPLENNETPDNIIEFKDKNSDRTIKCQILDGFIYHYDRNMNWLRGPQYD